MPTEPATGASATRPASNVCPECLGRGWTIVADGGAGSARPCDCRKRERGAELLARSGIPERYLRCTLGNFNVHNPVARISHALLQARETSKRYVDEFFDFKEGRGRETGLLFVGPPGVGKTHLATAVLAELIRRYQVRGRFVDFTSLIHDIQGTFDPAARESQHQILDPVVNAEVLVLDELGAQKPTEWVMDKLYLVINTRYTRRRPTIFTTNFRLDDDRPASRSERESPGGSDRAVRRLAPSPRGLGTRPAGGDEERPELLSSRIAAPLVSRLYEMAQPVTFVDWDYRREVMKHQHGIGR